MKGFRRKCGINYLTGSQTIAYTSDRQSILVGDSKLPIYWDRVAPLLLANQRKSKHARLISCNRQTLSMNGNEIAAIVSNQQSMIADISTRMNGVR